MGIGTTILKEREAGVVQVDEQRVIGVIQEARERWAPDGGVLRLRIWWRGMSNPGDVLKGSERRQREEWTDTKIEVSTNSHEDTWRTATLGRTLGQIIEAIEDRGGNIIKSIPVEGSSRNGRAGWKQQFILIVVIPPIWGPEPPEPVMEDITPAQVGRRGQVRLADKKYEPEKNHGPDSVQTFIMKHGRRV